MRKAVGTTQTAKLLDCSLGWVYVLIRTGELPAIRQGNGQWLIPLAAINKRRKRREVRCEPTSDSTAGTREQVMG
jgi:excisionase family DNA binding protein